MVIGSFEEEVFGPGEFSLEKLIAYGFTLGEDGFYHYQTKLSIEGFSAIFAYGNDFFTGKVIEDDLNEEYTAFRAASHTGFAFEVGQAYKKELEKIALACYSYNPRLSKQSNRLISHIKDVYDIGPEYPWHDSNCIFRHKDNNKWFALIMSIEESKLGRKGDKQVDVVNFKADPYDISNLTGIPGIYLAYHMNKKHWITVVLDEEVSDDLVYSMLEHSYHSTLDKKKRD